MTIYEQIKPTYLYIKQHTITKKKYFGKTTQDPYKYSGSGVYWTRHYKKHGKEHIKTLWVSDLYYDTSIVEVALHFSYENNIVKSTNWANEKPENGLDGGCLFRSLKSIQKMLNTKKERDNGPNSPDVIQKIKNTKKMNGTGLDNPVIIKKSLDTKLKNGTMNTNTPESIQKRKDTLLERGIIHNMKNPETVKKMLDTKKKNGTLKTTPEAIAKQLDTKLKNGTMNCCTLESIQKRKDTLLERGIEHPATIPFLSIIDSRKTYNKGSISRWYPELKQFY